MLERTHKVFYDNMKDISFKKVKIIENLLLLRLTLLKPNALRLTVIQIF